MSSPPHVVEELWGMVKLLSDGSIIRSPNPFVPTSLPIDTTNSVEYHDIIYDTTRNLQLRLYKPRNPLKSKLPVLLRYYAGGFCVGSRTSPNSHALCLRLASQLQLVVVVPDYRLAPEHCLPAAVEDAVTAFEWVQMQADNPNPFLADIADFANIFVAGDSAGGNLVHHLAARRIPVRGFVLVYPFFGGEERTKSELECKKDDMFNLEISDRCWRMSLPVGANRDDQLANPVGLEGMGDAPMLVAVAGADLLRDRDLEYAERLKGMGKVVEVMEFEGMRHGFLVMDQQSDAAAELVRAIGMFVERNVGANCV